MTQTNSIRSSDLVDQFGVVTHLAYTDGGYRELSDTTRALSYLGIDHVRDGAPNPAHDAYGQAHYAQAAAQGIHFTFVVEGGVDPALIVERVRAIERATPGAVTAIEGPNEVNNWPITYHGQTGTAAAQAYMRDLFNAVQADPVLRDITVTGFTDYPNHASTSDASSIHPYPKNGDQPLARIMQDMADQNAVDPGKPFYITEVGYHTQINPTSGWEGVSEAVQAKMLLNAYLDGTLLGAKQTYIFQLLDAYSGTSQEEHFGLFRLDNSPKPAATAIHNLTTILADTAGNASTFGTHTLDFTVTNAPDTGHTLLAEKSNGAFQLITWAEPDIWNENANKEISVKATNETFSFAQSFQTIEIFDPLLGTAAIQTFHNVNTVSVGVTDHPLIIQLSGAITVTPPVVTPPVVVPPVVTPPVAVTPANLSAGTGADTLVIRISEDAWKGDAQYTVKVDGVQVGAAFTAKALHSSLQSDTLTLHGNWGTGAHTVTVDFLNDAYGGTADTDRNLYVDGMTYNGAAHPELSQGMNSAGAHNFTIAATTPPVVTPPVVTPPTGTAANLTAGTGADTLVIRISEDAWKGDAQYTVKVDGVQVGAAFTAKALHSSSQLDTLTLHGNWGTGAHTVTVDFLNDAYGGTADTDRNLYVDGMTYNGAAHPELSQGMNSAGAHNFTIAATAPPVVVPPVVTPPTGTVANLSAGTGPDTLVLRISEDAWKGDAQYSIKVDGKQIGTAFTAKALHDSHQSDTLTLHGNWGKGTHTLTVDFLNDAYGGTAATDRNLYIDGATYNGVGHPELVHSINSGGAHDYVFS